MPARAFPLDAVSGAPAYTGRALRQTGVVDLSYATAARPLGARSGVRPGTPGSTLTVTSTTWTCRPHAGVLDVLPAAEASAYRYAIDEDQTGPMAPAHATLPRKDLLYLELSDPAESAGAAPGVTVKYLAGSPAPAGTEAVPATPARSMRLGWAAVPASGTGTPTATFDAPFMAVAGAPIWVRNQAERDALTALASAANPVTVERLDTGQLERNAGSGWLPLTGATEAPLTIQTGWTEMASGFSLARAYKSASGMVVAQGLIRRTGATIGGGPAQLIATLPPGYRPSGTFYIQADKDGAPIQVGVNSVGAISSNVNATWTKDVSYVSLHLVFQAA